MGTGPWLTGWLPKKKKDVTCLPMARTRRGMAATVGEAPEALAKWVTAHSTFVEKHSHLMNGDFDRIDVQLQQCVKVARSV
jgi:hypothetical protein